MLVHGVCPITQRIGVELVCQPFNHAQSEKARVDALGNHASSGLACNLLVDYDLYFPNWSYP